MHCTKDGKTVRVKSGCIEGLDWSDAVHIWTKRAVVQIPEGAKAWPEEPEEPEEENLDALPEGA